MATTEELAKLSKAAYNENFGNEDIPVGWTQIGIMNKNNGAKAGAYLNESTGEIVISYAGTDPKFNDAFNDVQIALEEIPNQFESALDFYKNITKIHILV